MSAPLTLTSLPLFPLGTVLYPGGVLSLQIFEVRYLDMIGKCHRAGAPFGVVALTHGSEVQQRSAAHAQDASVAADGFVQESFASVGTLAGIVEFASPQPGLMHITCNGAQRFSISRREKLPHGLWIADVTGLLADQTVPVPSDLLHTAIALGNLIKHLQQHGVLPQHMPLRGPYRLDDCGWVANRWCELLPIAPDEKQRLLELDNPLLRLELVSDILERTGIEP